MYFSDPVTPSALAMTGISAAHGLIAPAVIIFAGLALYTIAMRLRKNHSKID